MREFAGKTAVITGASSGIGRAIALELARHGVSLCLLGRNRERLEAVAASARNVTPKVMPYPMELTSDKEIKNVSKTIIDEFGKIEVLILSAGCIILGKIENANIAEFDLQFKTNVRAPLRLIQTLLPQLKANMGQIVFMNSSAGVRAAANVGYYSATKFALKGLADSLRDEVNQDGVRVISVFPGRTATPMQAAVHEMECRPYNPEWFLTPEDVASVTVNALGQPRSAEVTDIFIRPMKKGS